MFSLLIFSSIGRADDLAKSIIFMEFYKNTLHKQIEKKRNFSENFAASEIIEYLKQIAEGLNHMHSFNNPIIHRDLKVK